MEQQKDNKVQGPIGNKALYQGQNNNTAGRYDRGRTGQNVSHVQPERSFTANQLSAPAQQNKDSLNKNVKQGFAYVVRRMEKLTTALYLVTDIMSEKEPMKWKAREIVVDLLSDITIAPSLSVSERMTLLRNAIKKTEKVIAFLDVAQSAHLISEMNASMLKKEYLTLKDSIQEEWGSVYEKSKSIFSESFFEVPAESAAHSEEEPHVSLTANPPKTTGNFSRVRIQEDIKDKPIAPVIIQRQQIPTIHPNAGVTHAWTEKKTSTDSTQFSVSQAPVEKREMLLKDPTEKQISVTPTMRQEFAERTLHTKTQPTEVISIARNEAGRDDRRKVILTLIKEKPALTVKDIAKNIPHVSEKTIQRELLSMVIENVLVKRGERRWSTYSLRQQS